MLKEDTFKQTKPHMELIITNCNNIDGGKIEITNNKLNIKFGINGTGKSTITNSRILTSPIFWEGYR